MVEDMFTATLCFWVFYCLLLAHLSAASCDEDAVGVAGYILDSQLTASSELNASTPAKNGRLNFTAGPSWCASTGEANPYLQVDLQSLYIICAVSTQGNSQGSQWVEKYTLKLSTDSQTWRDYKENGKVKTFNGNFNENSPEKKNLFNGIIARYLRFVVVAKHSEACLRVEVFGVPRMKAHGNMALLKPTRQSSTSGSYKSGNAVEGGTGTHISKCTHTNSETNPWWRVDLGRVEPVAEVNLLNRISNAERLNGAEIRVGNGTANGGANNHLCANVTTIPAGKSNTFSCKPKAYGRYVYVRIPGDSKVLTLCEVEVYSSFLPNLALNKGVTQSSTAWDGAAKRAVDGSRNTVYDANSCTHTNVETDPWWRVDLGSSFPVVEVFIANRQCTDLCAKRLRGFEIRIGNDDDRKGGLTNPSCGGTHNMSSGDKRTFYCLSSPVGRYVSIRIPGNNKLVTLCEVEVYSTRQGRDNVKGCTLDPVGVSDSSIIPDHRFSALSSRSGSSPSYGRLKGRNAWIPVSNNDNNDYLQIDLGSVYFVCGVATQGNPNNDDWTKTYKIQTSLDNVNWNHYSENGSIKIFTGNDDRSSRVRSELYKPLAAKFIRFHPISFKNNKALRVEVYGSRQGCLTSLKNEKSFTPNFGITASSERGGHVASFSLLYGSASWCSSSVSPPQYLQVDFRQIITVTGLATQGDATSDKWVTSYSISYGYDGKTWISYGTGKMFTGNVDGGTVIVHWFSPPFTAWYLRIVPQAHYNGICMRMDLFGCKDFQVSLPLDINLNDVWLMANTGANVTLTCVASYSPRRPSRYEWRRGGTKLLETGSSLLIPYRSATDIYTNSCARNLSSAREVQCNSTYRCAASLSGIQDTYSTTANVIVPLKKPSQPVVQVISSAIKARSTTVTWSYSLGVDEMPVAFDLQYENRTYKDNILLKDVRSKELINLKPYTSYSVKLIATSVLGSSLWSNLKNFTTKTDKPEVVVPVTKLTSLTSQSIQVEWQKPNLDKLNGPNRGYYISYRNDGNPLTASASGSATHKTLQSLRKWTIYFIKIRVYNGDFVGPWGPEKQVRTQEDAPSLPENFTLSFQEPSESKRPQMTVDWRAPAEKNGIIRKYKLIFTYTFEEKVETTKKSTDNQTLRYSLDVLGGIRYSVELWAETIAPGPSSTKIKQVPVYKPSASPQNITSEKINETTYMISWNPLPREMSNGKVIAYEVSQTRLSTSRTPRSVSTPSFVLENTTDTSLVLTGLTSCSEYIVEVRAYTTAGAGVFGRIPRNIVTSAPGSPTSLKTEKPQQRNLTLRWSKPVLHGDAVLSYKIIYKGTKIYYPEFKPHTGTQETKSPTLNTTVRDLYPGTEYSFVVIAKTHCGYGDNSTVAQGSTKIDAPLAPNAPKNPEKIEAEGTSVNVTVWPANQTNGPISGYQLLVHRVNEWADKVPDWETLGPDIYIAAQLTADRVKPSGTVFLVGDGEEYDGHVNKELSNGQKYKIYFRGLALKPLKKRSTDRNYLFGEASLIAKVEIQKVIPSKPPTEFKKKESSSSPVAAIAGSVVAVLLIIAVIAAVLFWRRRRRFREQDSKSETHGMTAVNGAFDTLATDAETLEEGPPVAEDSVERTEATGDPIYGNTLPDDIDDKPKPVPVSRFSEYVTSLKRDKNAGFKSQYKMLSPGQQFSWDVAKIPENKNKNRYANIIAYDHSRVQLPLIDNIEHSGYINANYLHGYDETPKTYIACQGPVPGTFQDFWRMIWLENVSTIVMLTRLVEHGRTKCHQYWPDKSDTYHNITVTNHKTEKFADYAVRTFVVSKSGSEKTRQVQQFHFLVWPDKGVPRHATAVLGLRRKVRTRHNGCKHPLVVHCSAGVGRTGAFIVIDAMLESAENKKVVDVFNYVELLRTNRISMVQTEEQYGFIYMALLEAITCGNTEIPSCDLRIALKKLAAINPKTKMSGLASEYQRLELITADDIVEKEDGVGRKPVNASKNRFPDVIPLNDSRVVLMGDEKNDYINASFVDTYRERNSFIMTQAPLSNTIQNFWKMVWDYSVGTIVMLNEQEENGQVYPVYWPSEGTMKFGEFVIEATSHEAFQDYSERELTVAKSKDPKVVRRVHHYHVRGWEDKNIPSNPQCILDLITMVERSQRSSGNAPVVVQCSNGIGRSGTFCAILSIVERLKSEQVIDVCQSVKVIRVNRPKAVDCKKQYVFCYNIVQKYLDSFSDYANFN